MKKYLLLLLFVGAVSLGQAQDNELVWHTSFAKAKEISQKQNKPMLLFFTGSDWCGWCKRLQKEVFKKDEFATWAKKNVVLVELDFPRTKQLDDATRTQNYYLAQRFQVRGYPTIWFTSVKNETENGKTEAKLAALGKVGYLSGGATKWIGEANKILANDKK
ncbi:hypothetical protein NBRC110019_28240 [Neptunitalea chrysea]|uniref:Thioredoxin domain-containing protein n=1 Tax=Neptunitalea chrysea TaxID=1647581 RepID=A0A9W6EWV7_9FLAO|nr:thioredoxin family protein [Neptunitalea chrysea]GLB53783.1 hypothetical protein NBRC110019_28240 [Neptunitalea chrysea]